MRPRAISRATTELYRFVLLAGIPRSRPANQQSNTDHLASQMSGPENVIRLPGLDDHPGVYKEKNNGQDAGFYAGFFFFHNTIRPIKAVSSVVNPLRDINDSILKNAHIKLLIRRTFNYTWGH
jgi:hypothetical protein